MVKHQISHEILQMQSTMEDLSYFKTLRKSDQFVVELYSNDMDMSLVTLVQTSTFAMLLCSNNSDYLTLNSVRICCLKKRAQHSQCKLKVLDFLLRRHFYTLINCERKWSGIHLRTVQYTWVLSYA